MAWADLVVRALHDAAWPLAAIWLGWYFRDAIISQLPRITKVGPVVLDAPTAQQKLKAPTLDEKAIRRVELSLPPELLEDARQQIETKFPQDTHSRDDLLTLSAALLVTGQFERTYGLIFGSQLALVNRLNSSPVPIDEATGLFERAKENSPAFFVNYSFDDWLRYLEVSKLVTRSGASLLITPHGRGFLRYLIENGYSFTRLA